MDPVSFAFAAISMVDICLRQVLRVSTCISVMEYCVKSASRWLIRGRYGNDLYTRCQAYQHAKTELREAALCIQDHWIKLKHQISALRTVWESLDERLQIHQHLVLQVLQCKLQSAISKLDGLTSAREKITTWDKIVAKAKQLKYAAYAKASLDNIISDLDKWQRTFDPSWFFLARIAVPVIDQQLTEQQASESKAISTVRQLRQAHEANKNDSVSPASVFLQKGYERLTERESIVLSSASTGRCLDQRIIIDHIPVTEQADLNGTTRDVRDLARVLSKVDPMLFGLLSCRDVVKVRDSSTEKIAGFDFIFLIPPELSQAVPHSLRSLLLDQRTKYPLNERFDLAVSLARSIVFLHSSRFVHKNISPENIIVFQRSPDELGTPFLVGFERFRFAEGQTVMAGDCLWEKNLYRHPRRQGLHPEEQYRMQHDIYSVGICLLEIGLWSSFVNYSEDQTSITPSPELPISELIAAKDQRKAAVMVKDVLIKMARSRLPILMGKTYTDIVMSCLTCLDKNNEEFGNEREFEDEDGILVGVRYIEKVRSLRSLTLQKYIILTLNEIDIV
jgi:hypothetical protein